MAAIRHTGLPQVDMAGGLDCVHDGGGPGHVPGHGFHVVVAFGGQGPQMIDHHRVVIDIDHRGGAVVAADDLMHRRRGRQPRAEVNVLADGLGGHVVQAADQEPAVLSDHLPHTGVEGDQPFGQVPVGGEVILPARR